MTGLEVETETDDTTGGCQTAPGQTSTQIGWWDFNRVANANTNTNTNASSNANSNIIQHTNTKVENKKCHLSKKIRK